MRKKDEGRIRLLVRSVEAAELSSPADLAAEAGIDLDEAQFFLPFVYAEGKVVGFGKPIVKKKEQQNGK